MRSVHGAAATQTRSRRVSVAMPGSTRLVVVLGKERIWGFFFFIKSRLAFKCNMVF